MSLGTQSKHRSQGSSFPQALHCRHSGTDSRNRCSITDVPAQREHRELGSAAQGPSAETSRTALPTVPAPARPSGQPHHESPGSPCAPWNLLILLRWGRQAKSWPVSSCFSPAAANQKLFAVPNQPYVSRPVRAVLFLSQQLPRLEDSDPFFLNKQKVPGFTAHSCVGQTHLCWASSIQAVSNQALYEAVYSVIR